ncbi:BCD family MFS transporter [Pararhizobium mangrovi]|uniref:BCD family MFS transporter n=1 Tax=Pararhizobium mangrovi TaxID=2590452 RepID=A0A506U963_9HYPH|nr:BCD family MFS transporter [Pararhizobium mangrovi]TPW30420.1 BCD family MFS transporter [Pararhizobium mangrovi]
MTAKKAPDKRLLFERIGTRWMPFADAVSAELPAKRLLRLSLFQVSVAIMLVLLNSTLNRVMVVELGLPATLVAVLIALPVIFAPLRALIGFRSDNHRSAIGWRRTPYLWFGSLLQFGGLAIMPYALFVLSSGRPEALLPGVLAAGLSFILAGAGMHTVQTAGLALALDIAPEKSKPRVIAVLYAVFLLGMVVSSLVIGYMLRDFSPYRLIAVLSRAALVTIGLTFVSLWQQEPRRPRSSEQPKAKMRLRDSWRELDTGSRPLRLFVTIALGTAAFGMQDVLLEPYGGEVLGMSVSGTTVLTAISAGGTLVGFLIAARLLEKHTDPYAVAALGLFAGLPAFCAVIFAGLFHSVLLFELGAAGVGFGTGLFVVSMLHAVMEMSNSRTSGFALGVWGTVQASASGISIALGGAMHDGVARLASHGDLGPALTDVSVGYGVVYLIELGLIFAALIALGPLVTFRKTTAKNASGGFGLADMPS